MRKITEVHFHTSLFVTELGNLPDKLSTKVKSNQGSGKTLQGLDMWVDGDDIIISARLSGKNAVLFAVPKTNVKSYTFEQEQAKKA